MLRSALLDAMRLRKLNYYKNYIKTMQYKIYKMHSQQKNRMEGGGKLLCLCDSSSATAKTEIAFRECIPYLLPFQQNDLPSSIRNNPLHAGKLQRSSRFGS